MLQLILTKLRRAGEKDKFYQLFPHMTLPKAPKSALQLPLQAANNFVLSSELNNSSAGPLEVLGLEAFRPSCVISNSCSPISEMRPKNIVQERRKQLINVSRSFPNHTAPPPPQPPYSQ